VRLWEVDTGFPKAILRGHLNWVWCVGWAPDSSRFVTGGSDCRILCWEVGHNLPIGNVQAHMKSVNSVAFSPKDPSRVIAASSDGTISVWDIDRLELLYRMEGHIGSVTQVCVCPRTDSLLASAGEDATIRLWNLSDFTPDKVDACRSRDKGYNLAHHILKGHLETVNTLAFCADGLLLASGSCDSTVRIWNVSTKQPSLNAVFKAHESWVRALCWTLDQQILATTSTDGLISLWSVPRKYHIQTAGRQQTGVV
jgi:WD40 repeat protein